MLFVYGLGAWLLLIPLAIANGIFREKVIRQRLAEYPAHVLSTVMLSTVIALVVLAFVLLVAADDGVGELALLGALWVVMTVAFEFLFGHYVDGQSWATLAYNYNVLEGRVWTLVLVVLLVAPPALGALID
jgi:hypothetical protein